MEESSPKAGEPLISSEQKVTKSVAVKISNISPATSVNDIHDRFSYAGTISSIHLLPGREGSTGVAHVSFLEEAALETALLLSDASIKGNLVVVEAAEEGYSPPADASFYSVSSPNPPSQGAVKVIGVSSDTTVKDLHEFFSYAGVVSSILLHPSAGDQGAEAYIGFYEKKALDTALLLSDSKIKGNIVTVLLAPDYKPSEAAKFFPLSSQVGENRLKQAESMMKRLMEQGYTMGASAAQKAKEFDDKHQLTRSATTKAMELKESAASTVNEFQKRFRGAPGALTKSFTIGTQHVDKSIASGIEQMDKSLNAVDEKYHVTEKAQGIISLAEQRLNEVGDFFLQNKYLAQSRSFFMGTAAKVSEVVEGGGTPIIQTQVSASAQEGPIGLHSGAAGTGAGAGVSAAAAGGGGEGGIDHPKSGPVKDKAEKDPLLTATDDVEPAAAPEGASKVGESVSAVSGAKEESPVTAAAGAKGHTGSVEKAPGEKAEPKDDFPVF